MGFGRLHNPRTPRCFYRRMTFGHKSNGHFEYSRFVGYADGMHASQRRLVGLPVRTRSGHPLGKIADFIIDTDTGRIAFLAVRARGFIPGLMDQELRIAWAQVISLSDTEAVVADGSVPSGATRFIAGLAGKRLQAVPPSMHNAATDA